MDDTPNEYVVKGELSAPEPTKKKKRKWYNIVIDCVLVTAFLLVIAVSTNVIYLSVAFNMPFFVNGMSMYPTLNQDATDADGKPLSWARGTNRVGDYVDYGYAKSEDKDNWRAGLKRYDIVITYYRENYETTSTGEFRRDDQGKLILKENAKSKIKRIIGMPGETVKFDAVDSDAELYNRAWGKTTINPGEANETILKPLYTMADYPDYQGMSYTYPRNSSPALTLGENEYYVMGDNRGHSSDSRDARVGAILDEMIIGKAYLVIGKRQLDANLSPKDSWAYIFTPWLYRRIG